MPLEADSAALATIFGRTDSDPRTSSDPGQSDMGDRSQHNLSLRRTTPLRQVAALRWPLWTIVALHQLGLRRGRDWRWDLCGGSETPFDGSDSGPR